MKYLLIILLFYSTGFAQIDKKKIFFEDSVLPIMGGYQFDGSNYISISDNANFHFGTNNFSLEFFVNKNFTPLLSGLYGSGFTAAGGFTVYWSLGNNLRIYDSGVKDLSTFFNTTDTLIHIVLVRVGNQVSCYRNNSLIGTITIDTDYNVSHAGSKFLGSRDGGNNWANNYYLARFWNRALTSGEITTLYNNGRPDLYDATSMSGLVANYVGSNAGQIGWIETQNNLHGQTSGSPNTLLLTEEVQRPQTYRDIKTSIAASTNTAMLGVIPKGYRLVRIQATGTGSLTAIQIGTSSGGNQVVESVGTTGTETKDLSITSTGLALYSATSNIDLYARHTAAGQTMTLLFTFARVQ